jgi:hypothetical protein
MKIKINNFETAAFLILLGLTFSNLAIASYMPFNTSVNMNVGIGTSTPQGAFAVVNGNVGIGTWASGGGNLIVNGGGNAGISTVWPGQALDVNGAVRMTGLTLTGNGASSGYVMVGNSVGVGTWMPSATLNVTASGTTPGGSVPQLQYNSSGAIGGVAGSGADANGNIGIGTSGPLQKMAVAGNVGIGTGSASKFITTTPTANGLVMEGNVGIGTWKINRAALSVLNGNMGIGTWAPSWALEIEGGNVGIGTSNAPAQMFINADIPNGTTGAVFNNFGAPNPQMGVFFFTGSGNRLWRMTNAANGGLDLAFFTPINTVRGLISTTGQFAAGGSNPKRGSGVASISNLSVGANYYLLAAPTNGAIFQGNVGLGTMQPGSSLSVVGNIGIGTVQDGDNYVVNAAPNGGMAIEGNVGLGTYLPVQLLEIGRQKVDINSGGRMGIGTTAPSGQLEIEGGNVGINTAATTKNTLTVFGGNVGIGTTVAPDSLYVTGIAEAQNFKMNNAAGSGYVLVSNGVGMGTWLPSATLSSPGIAAAGGGVPQLQYNNGGIVAGVSSSGADANGNMGVGTSGPLEKLAVVGNVGIGTEGYSSYITTTPTAGGLVTEGNIGIGTWKIGSAALSVMNGNVGFGTWAASSALEVEGGNVGIGTINSPSQIYVYGNVSNGTAGIFLNHVGTINPVTKLNLFTNKGNSGQWSLVNVGNGAHDMSIQNNGNGKSKLTTTGLFVTGSNNVVGFGGSGISSGSNLAVGANYYTLAAPTNGAMIQGNVGLGTIKPGSVLTVVGNIGIGTVQDGDSYIINAAPKGGMAIEGNVGIGTWLPNAALIVRSGNVGIGTANANFSLQIGGCTTKTGTTSCVDMAELIPSSQKVSSGDVVMLDPSRSITVMKATRKDNDLLFGVVTTDPAIVIEGGTVGILNGKGYSLDPDKPAVALAGRVPVKVNLENGPIQVGDMITISSSQGIGTKAVRPGRVIGMALEPLADLRGTPYMEIYAYINPHWWPNMPFIKEELNRLRDEHKALESRLLNLQKKILGQGEDGNMIKI